MTGLEYQEHIQHTHNAFCKIVIRHTAIDMALRFEENECILVAMFQEESRQGTIEKIHSILPYMGEDVDSTYVGFDQTVLKQIKEYLNPSQSVMEPGIQELPLENNKEKPPLENWQKYMENGEYLRSSEIEEEQNYNMIDGRRNNMSTKGKREGHLCLRSCVRSRRR